MSETRVAVAKLLCKIFLHYLVTLAEWDGMLETWYKILELMERLMGIGQGQGMVCFPTPAFFFFPPFALTSPYCNLTPCHCLHEN